MSDPNDYDAKWDDWFDQQRENGMAVLARDEWKAKLDEAAMIGYAEGRADEREEAKPLIDELREALRDMLSGWIYIRQMHGDLYGVGWDRAQGKAEAAMANATTGSET